MLARIFVAIGGLVVLALTAALVVPYFIDWTSYRADFEREASAILGRKVTVTGAATARLLPFPSVTFADVSVGGEDGRPAMTVDTFSMDAELAPFLHGEVLIFDMRMEHPKAVVDVAADGAVDWAVRPRTGFDASRVSLESLTVTNGEVELRHERSGRSRTVRDINAVISAKSLDGPWRLEGSLTADGQKAAISVSAGHLAEDGTMRLRIRAEPEGSALVAETDGSVSAKAGALDYKGTFRLAQTRPKPQAAQPAAETAATAGNADPGVRIKGSFDLANAALTIDDFRFESGPLDNPYTADGKALVDFSAQPHFSVEAKGAQIQFDETVAAGQGPAPTLSERIAAIETAFARVPRPTIPGTVDVDLPAVVVGDTTIREVRLSAEPARDGWTVKSAAATLPGRTTLEASGFLSDGQRIGFSGTLLLAVAQPSGFAAWVSKDIDDAIRRLPAAGFSAKVELNATHQTFKDLELVLGDAKFRGEVSRDQPQGERASVQVKLAGDALDFDGLSAFASIFVSDAGVTRFADTDFDLQIKAGPIKAAGLTADTLDTAVRLRNGDLEIDRLAIGGLAGASVSATGSIKGFPASPAGHLDASVVSVDLAPLVRLAAQRFPGNAALRQLGARVAIDQNLFTDSRIDFVATTAANEDGTTGAAVSLQGKAGGTAVSASLSAKGRWQALPDAALQLTFSARNDDATPLLALVGLPALPLGLVGPGELLLEADGTPAKTMTAGFDLKGQDFAASFDGSASFGDKGPAAKGKLELKADDIEPWLMTTGVALPQMGSGRAVDLAADADYGDGLLVLENVAGTVDENQVAGDLNAVVKDGVPHITGQLTLDELDVEPFETMVLGEGTLVGDNGQWSQEPFKAQVPKPFTAELDLSADTVSSQDFELFNASTTLRIDGEGLRLDDVKGKLFGGDFSGRFELKNSAGSGLAATQFQLNGADLALALPDSGLSGAAGLSGSLSGSGKSVSAIVASLSGSGTASLSRLHVDGLNAAALPALLDKADGIGKDIDAAKTAALAAPLVAAGSFESEGGATGFTVAGGVLRAPALSFAGKLAKVSADLRADAGSGDVELTGSIVYDAGEDALAGAEPEIRFKVEGPLGATQHRFDTAALAQFLTERALQREQDRVEAMQAALIEKQRLRREARYYAALQGERDRAAEERRQAEEAARQKAEDEAKAAEDARLKAEEERRKAEEEQKRKAAQDQNGANAEPPPAADADAAAGTAAVPAPQDTPTPEQVPTPQQAPKDRPATVPDQAPAPAPDAGRKPKVKQSEAAANPRGGSTLSAPERQPLNLDFLNLLTGQ